MSTDKEITQHLLEAQRFELMKFRDSAEVPGVADILSSDIQKIDSKILSLASQLKNLEVDSVKKYRNLGTNHWYWAQDNKNVIIMLMISHVDSEKMEKNILSDFVDIKFHEVEGEGKHKRFVSRKLLKEIVPGGSSVEVKEDTVKIVLPKCEEGYYWSDLFKKDKLIHAFATASMATAYEKKWPLYLSTKSTIQKKYDGRFKDIFLEVYEAEWKSSLRPLEFGTSTVFIDDMVAYALESGGVYVWACKNYDGDVQSEFLVKGF